MPCMPEVRCGYGIENRRVNTRSIIARKGTLGGSGNITPLVSQASQPARRSQSVFEASRRRTFAYQPP